MKIILSLCLLILVSLVNAKSVNTEHQLMHSADRMMLSMDDDADCCSEGVHVNCGSFSVIDIPVIFSQEMVNNVALQTPILDVFYASFISKVLTPPPTV